MARHKLRTMLWRPDAGAWPRHITRHNRGHMKLRRSATMGFLIRCIACVAAVLSLSVLAAIAWDGSDQAARAAAAPATSNNP
jgi:hypothetical protein